MDFTKFASMLDKQALYFARLDKLGDPFEGSLSRPNVDSRQMIYRGMLKEMRDQLPRLYEANRRYSYACCWHCNEYESAAMWSIYLKSDEGIAIRSTLRRLKESLRDAPQVIHIGSVNYIDYRSDWMPEGNLFYPILHKRSSFRHEQEVRAFFPEWAPGPEFSFDAPSSPGHNVPVDLKVLIERVYVAPTSPAWIVEVVQSTIQKFGFEMPVEHSSLDDAPVY